MIDLHDIKEIVANLKERIEDKTRHSYLQRYMETPSIDEDKLLLLYSICEDLLLPKEQLTNYIVTTMLVQQALDTHETVPNRLSFSDERVRGQQLAILAGDYFSGLYYYLLAQASDITFIRILAEGIKDVNEAKIYLYQMDHDQVDQLLSYVTSVESAIFRKIVNSFQIKKWEEIVQNFLLLKWLLHERDHYAEDGDSILFKTLKKIASREKGEQETDVMFEFNKHLSLVCKKLEESLKTNPKINKSLLNRINELLLKSTSFTLKKIVEEG
ncbi:heptaprenyl diphosphate synthase component 1 [Bacillus sp. REN16]|uniref:heptaprenyl diphosphate synthase component 1 n=1 Tax=Bacillus sp. REN16 TaxID=2887296 RepID=UPI001E59C443|nr:heptaprenyl diphosphate synthase component 1 [Bacillus sp. REN16]MCC3358318.1 heptaprenyl diphosphate synthase component 1 [Bacillus sp. REN16]